MKCRSVVWSLNLGLFFMAAFLGMSGCPINADVNPIRVTVDPRMELLSVIQLLSIQGAETRYSFQYKREMSDYFASYKHHRAVILYNRMFPRFFNFDAPPTLMLYVSDPPALKPHRGFLGIIRKIADQRKTGVAGEKNMVDFINALRDFARDSNFQKFYRDHQAVYETMVQDTEREANSVDIVSPVENYYGGVRSLKYTILLAPLFHPGGYGPMVEQVHGVHELYDICGPLSVRRNFPVFGDANDICRLAWHEFGHSFVNQLVDRNWSSLTQYSSLYDPISTVMHLRSYGNWKTCVYEHIVRAVEARIIFKIEGRKASDAFIEEQRVCGFAYVKSLCECLEDYEKHRDKYPVFKSFFPQLVDVFRSLHDQDLEPDFYHISIGEVIWFQLRSMYQYQPIVLAEILAIIIFLPAISAIWSFRDARKRGKRGLPIVLLVLFGIWPIGLIVWLFLRRKIAV